MYVNGQRLVNQETYAPTQIKKFFFLKQWVSGGNNNVEITLIDDIGIYQLTDLPLDEIGKPTMNISMYNDKIASITDFEPGQVITAKADEELAPAGSKLMLVIYKDGKLDKIGISNDKLEVKLTLPEDLEACAVSAYLWDGVTNIKPVIKAVDFE